MAVMEVPDTFAVIEVLESAICMTSDAKTRDYIHMAIVRQRLLERRQQKASTR